MLTVDGNRGTNTILEKREQEKTFLEFGEPENKQITSREQGNSYPLEGPQLHLVFLVIIHRTIADIYFSIISHTI